MFLYTVGHNVRNRVVGHNFMRSGEIVNRYFNEVLRAISELRRELIRRPSLNTHSHITTSSRFMPYFKDCIGALDDTHVHASVPIEHVVAFRGRKPYPTQNVLVVVYFDLKFTYVLTGWKGSAHDALILRDALERPHGLRVPEGKFYLVDAGYATQPGFIAPYRGVKYHLKEWSSSSPSNGKELFNLRHSSLRTSVEHAFGSLKNRSKILTPRPFFPYLTQMDLVIAC
ncbi:protein ALP1-like [Canna indica]|uniref:Protein ALP1-like n=1 Tax=Canna indica TaxID=4628 RepID=A0AAQ3KLC5_9LILI|nr:protein ALP1-like [Canna indica]